MRRIQRPTEFISNRLVDSPIKFVIALLGTLLVLGDAQMILAASNSPIRNEDETIPAAQLVLMDQKKGLQIVTFPASDAADQALKTRSVGNKPAGSGFPIGVFGGHLISIYGGQLLLTDLSDGTLRSIPSANVKKAAYASGQLYFVSKLAENDDQHTHELTHVDLETLVSTSICA